MSLGHAKRYGRCSRKHRARQETVIDAYRSLTGLQAVPRNLEYWTLCGDMSDDDGGLQPTCELNHVLSEGLIIPAQFRGVERLPEVQEPTERAVRKVYGKGPKVYFGELTKVLDRSLAAGTLRPAIVNLDTILEPMAAARLLGSVLDTLNHVEGSVMVVLNVIMERKHLGVNHTFRVLVDALASSPFCQVQLRGWSESDWGYRYRGTGKRSHTIMGTTVFYRERRAVSAAS